MVGGRLGTRYWMLVAGCPFFALGASKGRLDVLWRGAWDVAERRSGGCLRLASRGADYFAGAFADVAAGEVHFFNANGREYPRI
jgi:hypothetical protein